MGFYGEECENDLSRKYVPKNTAATTKWALSNFNAWKQARNKRFAGDSGKCVPDNILETTDSVVLCKWLRLYIDIDRETFINDFLTLLTSFALCCIVPLC